VNEGLTLSVDGLSRLCSREGFSPVLYDDVAGFCTIGFGHLVHRGRTGTCEAAEAGFRGDCSYDRAKELLREDVGFAEVAVRTHVKYPLLQPQFDALVSFVFNVGVSAFHGSTLLKHINRGQFNTVPAQFLRWIFAGGNIIPGLLKRRKEEAAQFAAK